MPIVDAHCHVSRHWYEPVEVLLRQMDANEVERAVLIQMMGQFDNSYQRECVRRFPDRLASVVIVDASRDDAVEHLRREAESGAAGVRLGPATRSPGEDPLAIWRAAAELRLTVSCGGSADDFASPEFAHIFDELPELPIVIEHLGSVNRPDDDARLVRRRRVFALGRRPNAYIKIHGLGEFCQRAMPVTQPFPFVEPIPPLLEMACQEFGPAKMMWGSDYPPVSSREGYRNALRLPMDVLASRTDDERALIFGGTAISLFTK